MEYTCQFQQEVSGLDFERRGGGGWGSSMFAKYYLVVKAMDLPILETQNKYVPGDFT